MRNRLFPVLLAAALVAPLATIATAQPAGAAAVVTSSPSWTLNTNGWDRSSSPTIADINGDGRKEIVIGHQDGYLRVLDGGTGRPVAHWPQQTGTAIDSTPAVGDLFNNGKREIVVGLGSTWVRNQQGGVAVYNADGTLPLRVPHRRLRQYLDEPRRPGRLRRRSVLVARDRRHQR